MPNYLRRWNDRTILVRPTKWDGAEEIPPWDCLDITAVRNAWEEDTIKKQNQKDEVVVPKSLIAGEGVRYLVQEEIRKNYSLYRSRVFSKKYADNPRMNNPFFGCCVVAAEALYFLTPEDRNPRCYRAADGEGLYHWWNHYDIVWEPGAAAVPKRLDATHEQFDGLSFSPPYASGKKTALMGWKQSPSKRSLDLIENISSKTIRYRTFDGRNFMPVDEETGNIDLDMIISRFS